MTPTSRAEEFITSVITRFKTQKPESGPIMQMFCHQPVQIGKEWYTVMKCTYHPCPDDKMSVLFHFSPDLHRGSVGFYGNYEHVVSELASLLQYGFCLDCGERSSATHTCRNLEVDKLNIRCNLTCSICMEPCNGATRMPCGHEFHWMCLSGYYKKTVTKTCPLCRKRVRRHQWDIYFLCESDEDNTDDEDEAGDDGIEDDV